MSAGVEGQTPTAAAPVAGALDGARSEAAIAVDNLSRRFGRKQALSRVSLQVGRGEIHALLGPNGAGKTTLLRVLAGLVDPNEGEVRVFGELLAEVPYRRRRRLFGVVPSGDRSFYLRVSGIENLVFFARLHGLDRRAAVDRASASLRDVGLTESARAWVGTYSHGMQKRLSVARALLMEPVALLVDEATHDLDPEGARTIRALVAEMAGQGTAVLWATQRLDEIRGFADRVTLLRAGHVGFNGSVSQLIATAATRRYLVRLHDSVPSRDALAAARAALAVRNGAILQAGPDADHFLLALTEQTTLGEAVASLVDVGIDVLAISEERSGVEEAFLNLTRDRSA